MKTYTYNAELLCENCGRNAIRELLTSGEVPEGVAECRNPFCNHRFIPTLEQFEDSLQHHGWMLCPAQCGDTVSDIRRCALDESSYDSDSFPKGPDAASESDSPEHCGTCGVFLENPLTSDGEQYVRESGNAEWLEFYDLESGDDEPTEDDYVTRDHTKFYQYRKLAVTVPEGDNWKVAVSAHMDREQFWPNVFFEFDHGNWSLLTLTFDDSDVREFGLVPIKATIKTRDSESLTIEGQFAGDCDTFGKWTFQSTSGDVHYLFPDELVSIELLPVETE